MSIMETKWGLIPDMGMAKDPPQLMRGDHAKELMMTAQMLDAEAAQAAGLITRIVVNLLKVAKVLAVELLERSSEAVNGSKALIDQTWNLPPGEALAIEARMQANIRGSPNQIEAVMAGLVKRPPKFI